jgi:hypothetical protein
MVVVMYEQEMNAIRLGHGAADRNACHWLAIVSMTNLCDHFPFWQ